MKHGGTWVDLSIRWIALSSIEYVLSIDGVALKTQKTSFSDEAKKNIVSKLEGCAGAQHTFARFGHLTSSMRQYVDGAIAETLEKQMRGAARRALRLRVCAELFELPWECVEVSRDEASGQIETWASAYCAVRWFEPAVHSKMPLRYSLFADDSAEMAPRAKEFSGGIQGAQYFNLIDDVDDAVRNRRKRLYNEFLSSGIVHIIAHGEAGEDGRVTVLRNVDPYNRSCAGLICPEDVDYQVIPELDGCLFLRTPLVMLMDACHSAKFSLANCFMNKGDTRLYIGHLEAVEPVDGRGSVFVQHFFDELMFTPKKPKPRRSLISCIRAARHAGGNRTVMHDLSVCCVSGDVMPLDTLDQLLGGTDGSTKHWALLWLAATLIALFGAFVGWILADKILVDKMTGTANLSVWLPIATGIYAGAMCSLISHVFHSARSYHAAHQPLYRKKHFVGSSNEEVTKADKQDG